MDPDGKTWSGVATVSTIDSDLDNSILMDTVGMFAMKLIPEAVWVYTYRVKYDGDGQKPRY